MVVIYLHISHMQSQLRIMFIHSLIFGYLCPFLQRTPQRSCVPDGWRLGHFIHLQGTTTLKDKHLKYDVIHVAKSLIVINSIFVGALSLAICCKYQQKSAGHSLFSAAILLYFAA